jgi:hypothetical protein
MLGLRRARAGRLQLLRLRAMTNEAGHASVGARKPSRDRPYSEASGRSLLTPCVGAGTAATPLRTECLTLLPHSSLPEFGSKVRFGV